MFRLIDAKNLIRNSNSRSVCYESLWWFYFGATGSFRGHVWVAPLVT